MLIEANDNKKSPSLLMIINAVSKGSDNIKEKQKLTGKMESTQSPKPLPTIADELSQMTPPADGKKCTKKGFLS